VHGLSFTFFTNSIMFNTKLLQEDLDRVRSGAAETLSEVTVAKRQLGLTYLVQAQKGQSLADVQAVFTAIHPDFVVERLYPEELFTPVSADFAAPFEQYETGFVATLAGLSHDDLQQNSFDLAYLAEKNGHFVRVDPEFAAEVPSEPESESKPNEPRNEVPSNHAWSLAAMRVRQAWEASGIRGKGMRIAHIDTGWTPHIKWAQGGLSVELGRNFIPGEPFEDPRDRLNQGSTYQPGHGTHTGTVMTFRGGIRADDGDTIPPGEVTGVAPEADNVPLRAVLSVILYPRQTEVARAIVNAVQQGFPIISMSLGGTLLWEWLGGPLQLAERSNCIVVAASGNYLDWVLPGFRFTVEPAKYNEVIGVAGSTFHDKPWELSGRVPYNSVDIAAPAENVWAGLAVYPGGPNNRFGPGTGTSYATANLAGVAALWLAKWYPNGYRGPSTAIKVFREHIRRTARKPADWNTWFGAGIVNAHQLMVTAPNPNASLSLSDSTPMVADEALASVLVATDAADAAALVGKLLGGLDAAAVAPLGRELARIISQDNALRSDLCRLSGSLTEGDMPSEAAVQAALLKAVTAHGSMALQDILVKARA
jgi:subtilisin family serine protease